MTCISLLFLTLSACNPSTTATNTTTTLNEPQRIHADKIAIENLRMASKHAQALYKQQGSWELVTVPKLSKKPGGLIYLDSPSFKENEISVAYSENGIVLAVHSDSGACFALRKTQAPVTEYATGNCVAVATGALPFSKDPQVGWATTTSTSVG